MPLTDVELELLDELAVACVPDDGGMVHAAGDQQITFVVPLETEDGALVACQRPFQVPCSWEQSRRVAVRRRERLGVGGRVRKRRKLWASFFAPPFTQRRAPGTFAREVRKQVARPTPRGDGCACGSRGGGFTVAARGRRRYNGTVVHG